MKDVDIQQYTTIYNIIEMVNIVYYSKVMPPPSNYPNIQRCKYNNLIILSITMPKIIIKTYIINIYTTCVV